MSNQAIPVDADELTRLREELLQCRSKLALAAESAAGSDELIAELVKALQQCYDMMIYCGKHDAKFIGRHSQALQDACAAIAKAQP